MRVASQVQNLCNGEALDTLGYSVVVVTTPLFIAVYHTIEPL